MRSRICFLKVSHLIPMFSFPTRASVNNPFLIGLAGYKKMAEGEGWLLLMLELGALGMGNFSTR